MKNTRMIRHWLGIAAMLAGLGQPLPGIGAVAEAAEGLWIDVRTAEEFTAGHLPGALHIPFDEIGGRIGEATLDKDRPIHLYCRSGRRSAIATDTLRSLGYRQVTNAGAYDRLREAPPSP